MRTRDRLRASTRQLAAVSLLFAALLAGACDGAPEGTAFGEGAAELSGLALALEGPGVVALDVPAINQNWLWNRVPYDCSLTSTQMVIRYYGADTMAFQRASNRWHHGGLSGMSVASLAAEFSPELCQHTPSGRCSAACHPSTPGCGCDRATDPECRSGGTNGGLINDFVRSSSGGTIGGVPVGYQKECNYHDNARGHYSTGDDQCSGGGYIRHLAEQLREYENEDGVALSVAYVSAEGGDASLAPLTAGRMNDLIAHLRDFRPVIIHQDADRSGLSGHYVVATGWAPGVACDGDHGHMRDDLRCPLGATQGVFLVNDPAGPTRAADEESGRRRVISYEVMRDAYWDGRMVVLQPELPPLEICAAVPAGYADADPNADDRYWGTDADPAQERLAGARFYVRAVDPDDPSHYEVMWGFLGDGSTHPDGCTGPLVPSDPTLRVPGTRYQFKVTSYGRVGDQWLYVSDRFGAYRTIQTEHVYTGSGADAPAILVLDPTDTIPAAPADGPPVGEAVFEAWVTATHALGLLPSGVSGAAFNLRLGASNVASTYCDRKSNYYLGNGEVCLTHWGANRRFVTAHELGHAVAARGTGNVMTGGQCSSDATGPMCPGEPAGVSHSMRSRQNDKCAVLEGFAHFYAAAALNYRPDGDCRFVYYKDVEGDAAPVLDCDHGDALFPVSWGLDYCSVEGGYGVELDWLRAFWDLYTGAGADHVYPPMSFAELLDLLASAGPFTPGDAFLRIDEAFAIEEASCDPLDYACRAQRWWWDRARLWNGLLWPTAAVSADCPANQMRDCDGVCKSVSWLGDGICDNGGANEASYDCEAFDWDRGDCPSGRAAEDHVISCSDTVVLVDGLGDGECDPEFDCLEHLWDAGDCNPCPVNNIRDCNGDCYPVYWVGDSICDDGGQWGAAFDCPAFLMDGNACAD